MENVLDRVGNNEYDANKGASVGGQVTTSVLQATTSYNESKESKPVKATLKLAPISFDDTTKSKILTNFDLCRLVNSAFNKAFRDFIGSTLWYDSVQARFKIDITFRENGNAGAGEGLLPNLIAVGGKLDNNSTPAKNPIATAQAISGMRSGGVYKLTKETQEILSNYYMPFEKADKKNDMPLWNQGFIIEAATDVTWGYSSAAGYNYGVTETVRRLDLIMLLREIWDNKNDEDHRVDYAVSVIRSIPMANNQDNRKVLGAGDPNYVPIMSALMQVNQLDTVECEKLCNTIGMVPAYNGIYLIR